MNGCEPIEFDVDFAGITESDLDLTINWHASNIESEGIFYTDSNGLGMVKRQTKHPIDDINN